jgi:uncharacterized membrane protein YozB (DUF420 family)
MTAAQIFQIVNPMALVGWMLLLLFPNWKHTKHIITILFSSLLFAGIYVVSLSISYGKTGGNFSTLEGVRLLFTNDFALLAGWVHYLAFDLFVGTWEVEDSKVNGISRFLMIPCLFLTFMFGPTGLLCYTILKLVMRKPILTSINI